MLNYKGLPKSSDTYVFIQALWRDKRQGWDDNNVVSYTCNSTMIPILSCLSISTCLNIVLQFKMTDAKEQCLYAKFCIKLRKMVSETNYVANRIWWWSIKQWHSNCFRSLKTSKHQLKMTKCWWNLFHGHCLMTKSSILWLYVSISILMSQKIQTFFPKT